jgi:hypothetical protein
MSHSHFAGDEDDAGVRACVAGICEGGTGGIPDGGTCACVGAAAGGGGGGGAKLAACIGTAAAATGMAKGANDVTPPVSDALKSSID